MSDVAECKDARRINGGICLFREVGKSSNGTKKYNHAGSSPAALMKALIISALVTVATFIFGTKPFLRVVGGSAKMWVVMLFDLTIGALTYALLK
jgi:hypothetical protein